jgi:FkbM family methyltransferase
MDVVESRYGKLIVNPLDVYIGGSLLEYGEFSEGEVALFKQLLGPDDVVCDVGANIGAHTLAFSRLAAYVHAFEPHPSHFNALCGMVALNDLKNVSCHHVGIGEKECVMSYPDFDTGHRDNFGGINLEAFNGQRPISVYPLTTPCTFLKVDVEGMELEVLKGAKDMIKECKPVLYIENDRPNKSEELIDYVKSLGYIPHWHTPALFNPENIRGKVVDIFGGVGSINMLCSPIRLEFLKVASGWPFTTQVNFGDLENRRSAG